MPRDHTDLQQQWIRVGFQCPEFCHVFYRLPVHHLAVVQARFYEHSRVILTLQVCVWAVVLDVEIIFHALWVPPLLVFADGQRKRWIKHRVQHIHKWDMTDDDSKEVGPHVRSGAHQKAAGAATFDDEFLCGGVALGDEVFGCGDEIGECVSFLLHASSIVPGFAELSAASDVSYSVNHTAIQKADTIRTEVHRDGHAVAAVSIEKKRGRAITRRVPAGDDGKRHAGAVPARAMQPLTDVPRPTVPPNNTRLHPQPAPRR